MRASTADVGLVREEEEADGDGEVEDTVCEEVKAAPAGDEDDAWAEDLEQSEGFAGKEEDAVLLSG